jgi:Fe-S-cluster-containing dehydrogenase component
MAQLGMVIDLHKCVGCGACALGCKTENNTGDRTNGQSFNWADFMLRPMGTFPKVGHEVLPVLCNHCSNAACVEACPVTPTAMFKSPDGITLHNDERCIGCQSCQDACPYSVLDLDDSDAHYSVISFNEEGASAFARYEDNEPLIDGCTAAGAEVVRLAGTTPPHRTDYRHPDYGSVRRANVTEKCMFCAHRLAVGELPACVEACPAGARVFGAIDDRNSDASKALMAAGSKFVLKPKAGTSPNVHYINSYNGEKNG